jgi:hypothetical protein
MYKQIIIVTNHSCCQLLSLQRQVSVREKNIGFRGTSDKGIRKKIESLLFGCPSLFTLVTDIALSINKDIIHC